MKSIMLGSRASAGGQTSASNKTAVQSELRMTYRDRMASYIPRHINAKLLIIVSEESAKNCKFNGYVLKQLAPQTKVTIVPGTHDSCVTDENCATVVIDAVRGHLSL